MMHEQRFAQDTQKLMNALFAQRDLPYVINVASSVFDNPIFLIDNGFRLITKSNESVNDSIWNDLSQTGYYSYDNLRFAKNDKRYALITQSKNPIYVHVGEECDPAERLEGCSLLNLKKKSLNNSRLIYNIYNKNVRLGSITVIEYRTKLESYHVKLLEFLCKVVLVQMNLSPSVLDISGGNALANIISDILAGNIIKESELQSRLKFFGIHLKKYFYVLAIQHAFKNNKEPLNDLNHYQTILSYLLNNHNTLVYQNCILFVINTDDRTLFDNPSFEYKMIQDLITVLRDNELIGAISNSFESLINMKRYYEQASKALTLGPVYGDTALCFFRYNDYIFEDIIDQLISHNSNADLLYHPRFQEIIDYDTCNNTNHLETLSVYLRNSNNMQEAARQLHIHRNSLAYRLNKIQELFGVDLSDIKTLYHLYISFKIKDHNRVR